MASSALSHRKKVSAGDKALNAFFYLFLLLFALMCLFPFLLVIVSSFTDEQTLLINGYSLFPKKWSVAAYRLIFATGTVFDAYKVTIFITVVGTALSMLLTSATAYSLSIKTFRSRNRIAMFMYFTMLFGGGLVATYLLISKYLGMRDTIWVMIIPGLVSPWNALLMRNFFNDIPVSLSESATLDGAGDLCILFKIILPISKPAIATISLFYALGYWNQWYNALLYIDKSSLFPLQYLIMTIVRNANFASAEGAKAGIALNLPTYTVRMATVIVTIGPIIFLYPFVQKYFVKGLTVGSIKG